MTNRPIAFLAMVSAGLVGALPAACAPEELVALTLPDGSGDAGRDGPGPGGPRCDGDDDCQSDAFCARGACGDPQGRCELRPAFCGEGAPSPVCGCDGVTYWNDCVRRARGQSSATPGECALAQALACGGRGGRNCPPGTTCARIAAPPSGAGPTCPPDLPGVCWAVPPVCAGPPGIDRFVRCGPGGPGAPDGGATPCVDLCTAIRSGEPHFRALSCP